MAETFTIDDVVATADFAFDHLTDLNSTGGVMPHRLILMRYVEKELGIPAQGAAQAVTMMEQRKAPILKDMGYHVGVLASG